MTAPKDRPMKPAANPPLNWKDDPTIVLLNDVLGHAVERVAKGGHGGYIEVAEYDQPNPDPDGEPIQGATIRLVVPTPEIAEQVRSRLGSEFPDLTIERSTGPGTDTALMFWLSGLHGRVGTYTNMKCHELLCRTANAQENLLDKQRRIEFGRAHPELLVHGRESTRVNYLCPCRPCKDAHNAAANFRKQRRRVDKVIKTALGMGGQVTAGRSADDPAEATVYLVLPTVDDAVALFRVVSPGWAGSEHHGFQVSFVVAARVAAALDLIEAIPEDDPEAVVAGEVAPLAITAGATT